MKFTLNYLMIKRLGEMGGFEYSNISPMNEIAPYLRHPVCGKTVAVLLQELRDREQCQE